MKKSKIRIAGKMHSFAAPEQAWKITHRPGGWVVLESPEGRRCRMAMTEVRGKLTANIGGIPIVGEIQQERAGSVGLEGGGDTDLVAEFPGKVRKLLVENGQTVKAGEPLLLVEAMKMEFTIKAPADGKIRAVLVKEGQQLSPGDRFLDLEPVSEA